MKSLFEPKVLTLLLSDYKKMFPILLGMKNMIQPSQISFIPQTFDNELLDHNNLSNPNQQQQPIFEDTFDGKIPGTATTTEEVSLGGVGIIKKSITAFPPFFPQSAELVDRCFHLKKVGKKCNQVIYTLLLTSLA